jgi:hypothetical protein
MRKPNWMLALMAGVMLMAFLPLDDAAAVESDEASRKEARQYVLNSLDAHYQKAMHYRGIGFCPEFSEQLQWFDNVTDQYVRVLAGEYKTYLPRVDRLELTQLAKDRARELRELDCPPKGQTVTDSNVEISVGGGASSVWAPPIPVGTERRGDEEFAITETDDQLSGGSFNVEVTAPLSPTYSGYVNYQFTEADGSSSARVPEGDRLVAVTFSFANPATDNTGIGPSPFGINITTHTDFEMNDVQFGFGAPVNFFGPSVVTRASIGGRYINIDRTDRIGQQLIQFPDITQNIHVGQDTDFFGVQFGLDVENRPFQESGFVYGASGSISFLANSNDAQVRALVDCPQCPEAGDRNFTLRTSLDEGPASLAVDGEVHLGYQFSETFTIQIFASVTHFTDMPVVHLPVSPFDELLVSEDDFTSATVGAKAKFYMDFAGFDVLPRSRQ